ncbi:hypothetical protein [Streptomyces sp. NBC_00728]|uniref:hypothetical protein n=1 Tax=Streptomyces sp. NBC_00728 TaxID=2903676 RepID=UPI00386F9ADF
MGASGIGGAAGASGTPAPAAPTGLPHSRQKKRASALAAAQPEQLSTSLRV